MRATSPDRYSNVSPHYSFPGETPGMQPKSSNLCEAYQQFVENDIDFCDQLDSGNMKRDSSFPQNFGIKKYDIMPPEQGGFLANSEIPMMGAEARESQALLEGSFSNLISTSGPGYGQQAAQNGYRRASFEEATPLCTESSWYALQAQHLRVIIPLF